MATLVIILVVFAVGVVAGIVWAVSLGVRSEDDGPFLPEEAPDGLTRGTRRLTGLYVRQAAPRAPAGRESLLTAPGPR